MNVFISGGAKNGKTAFAEDVAVRLSGAGKRYEKPRCGVSNTRYRPSGRL